MRFSFCENNQELGALSASHLWADVYRLSRHSSEKYLDTEKWLELYRQAISYARHKKASQVIHMLVEDGHHAPISQNLPHLNFVKKDDRVEFRHALADLPGDEGTPFGWKDAQSLGWGEEKIAQFTRHVAQGDPTYDPAESALDFVQSWLSDPVLTCGLDLIWIGHIKGAPAALVVAQVNPASKWSRISYMGLAAEHRGKGLGQWVHRKGFSALKQQGGILYHGGTSIKNAAMLKLFERHKCQRHLKMEEWQLNLS